MYGLCYMFTFLGQTNGKHTIAHFHSSYIQGIPETYFVDLLIPNVLNPLYSANILAACFLCLVQLSTFVEILALNTTD